MKNERLAGKNILITGASSGIGEAIALALAGVDCNLVLVARRGEMLASLSEKVTAASAGRTRVDTIGADLTTDDGLRSVTSLFARKELRVDILVNNAGGGWYGWFRTMPIEKMESIIALNVTATVRLTRWAVEMNRNVHVINIGSIAGSFPNQGIAMYTASKAFVDVFSRSLYRETKWSGAHVTLVKPGAVKTAFFDKSSVGTHHMPGGEMGITVSKVAKAVVAVMKRPKKVVYLPFFLAVIPWVELVLGRIIDLLGPLLLKRSDAKSNAERS